MRIFIYFSPAPWGDFGCTQRYQRSGPVFHGGFVESHWNAWNVIAIQNQTKYVYIIFTYIECVYIVLLKYTHTHSILYIVYLHYVIWSLILMLEVSHQLQQIVPRYLVFDELYLNNHGIGRVVKPAQPAMKWRRTTIEGITDVFWFRAWELWQTASLSAGLSGALEGDQRQSISSHLTWTRTISSGTGAGRLGAEIQKQDANLPILSFVCSNHFHWTAWYQWRDHCEGGEEDFNYQLELQESRTFTTTTALIQPHQIIA